MDDLPGGTAVESLSRPTVLLDPDFVIRAANTPYLTATGRAADELVGMHMFDAFPDNPEDPGADGVARLDRSLQRAARQRRPDNMLIQRYDIRHVTSGEWLQRHWSPLNTPLVENGRVVALLHQVEDVTPLEANLRSLMEHYRDLLQDHPGEEDDRGLADAGRAFVDLATTYKAMAVEITQLRYALTSRATIDQAKGIVMAEHRCSPDAAFDLLRRLSQDTNVKVSDVAAALVYQAQGGETQDQAARLHQHRW